MRSLLTVLVTSAVVAATATPASAFWSRKANLPVPGRATAEAYNPGHWWTPATHKVNVHPHHRYPTAAFNTMPDGCPPGPPAPPFCMGGGCPTPMNLPQAPDLFNTNPYGGVLPGFPPFQGMLLGPNRGGPGGFGNGNGGGPGVFGAHPFARSPRDFFMAGD